MENENAKDVCTSIQKETVKSLKESHVEQVLGDFNPHKTYRKQQLQLLQVLSL